MYFGRQLESQKLADDFSRVQRGDFRQVMVSGPPGVGKTGLVRQFSLAAEQTWGSFVYGKADPRRDKTPFAPISAALSMLVKKFIADHPQDRAKMAQTLASRLGKDLDQAIFLVPALKFLFDDAVDTKGGSRRQEETPFLNNLFYCLIEIFAPGFKGLVLFFDDLQWFDSASLKFLVNLAVTPPLYGVLLILGFRNQKENLSLECLKTMDIYQGLDSCRHLALKGLPRRDIKALLKARLDTAVDLTPLADLCFEKTRGNPLYLVQMVEDLLDRGLVRQMDSEWICDLDGIGRLRFSENIADIVITRIRLLDPDARMLLQHGACIQNGILPEVLSATTGLAGEIIETLLWKPLKLNFLQKKGRAYYFAHDKILEAVDCLIPVAEKIDIHRRLTAFYLDAPSKSSPAASVFTLLYHYGFFSDQVRDPEFKKKMVQNYLEAGKEAWAKTAYGQALEWFVRGKAHFPGDIWKEDYGLALAFSNWSAECAYLSGDFEAAEKIFSDVNDNAKDFRDRVALEMVKISCYQARGLFEQAKAKGIEILGALGIHIPESPSWPRVVSAILKTWAILVAGRYLSGTKQQRQAKGQARQILKVLTAMGGIAFILSPDKFLPFITAKAFEFTLRHGHSSETPTLYIAFGRVLNRVTGSVTWGRKLSAAARRVSRDMGSQRFNGKEMLLSSFFLDHWDRSLQETAAAFEEGRKISLEQGDHEYYGYHTILSINSCLLSGLPLGLVLARVMHGQQVFKRLNHPFGRTILSIQQQVIANLMKGVHRPWELGADLVDEEDLSRRNKGLFFDLNFYRLCAAFFCGNMTAALTFKREIDTVIKEMSGTPSASYFYFVAALVEMEADNAPKQGKKCLKRLKWCAANNPRVYGPKSMIAQGEWLRVSGHLDKARSLFQMAAAALEESPDALFEKGLVYEKLARIAQGQKDAPGAERYLDKSAAVFRQWGLTYRYGQFEPVLSLTSGPGASGPIPKDDLETALCRLLDLCCAKAVHAVVLDALQWRTAVQVTPGKIHYPSVFYDLPDKMLTFAGAAGELVAATVQDSEEAFFDTAYFFKHHPTSLMVIPGGQTRGIFIENPEKEPDIATLMELARTAFQHIRLSPPAAPALPETAAEEILRLKSCCLRLQTHMVQTRPYKDPRLSLGTLASSLGISPRIISHALNTCLGQNVQTFINTYRIEAVKAEMSHFASSGKTVLEIAFEQGFNSKPTFNRSFKKQTGMTPSEYRKALISNQKEGLGQV